jgi:hypothetical protein
VIVTRPLADILGQVGLSTGDYVLTWEKSDDLEPELFEPLAAWPEPLSEGELAVPWVILRGKREPGQPPMIQPSSSDASLLKQSRPPG